MITPGRAPAVFVLVSDEPLIARIAGICRGSMITRPQSAGELRRLLPADSPATVVMQLGPGGVTVAELVELRRLFPWTTRILISPVPSRTTADIIPAIRTGLDEIIVQGTSDSREHLEIALRGADARKVGRMLWAELDQRLRGRLVGQVVRIALLHVGESLTPRLLAESVELGLRTFERRLQSECAITVRELIAWARVLVVVYMLEHSGWPVELIASKAGFADSRSLYAGLHGRVGRPASDLRPSGSTTWALNRFVTLLDLPGRE